MPSPSSGLQSALHVCLAGATCGCFAILLAHNPAKLAGLEERTLGELDDIQPLARVVLLAVYLLMVLPQVLMLFVPVQLFIAFNEDVAKVAPWGEVALFAVGVLLPLLLTLWKSSKSFSFSVGSTVKSQKNKTPNRSNETRATVIEDDHDVMAEEEENEGYSSDTEESEREEQEGEASDEEEEVLDEQAGQTMSVAHKPTMIELARNRAMESSAQAYKENLNPPSQTLRNRKVTDQTSSVKAAGGLSVIEQAKAKALAEQQARLQERLQTMTPQK